MTLLGVNVDHVATIRQARGAPEPDPVTAALLAELAGADGITVHLRGDRRHIQERDVVLLRQTVTTRLNIELAASEEMLEIALDVKPDAVTLVPERPDEITTEGGLDVVKHGDEIGVAVERLRAGGIQVSLFLDPDRSQIEAASAVGAPMVELNTAAYAEAVPLGLDLQSENFRRELETLRQVAQLAHGLQLRVLAGHGLTYRNVGPVSRLPQVEELNIGHNIVARGVLVGMERAVGEMLQAMNA